MKTTEEWIRNIPVDTRMRVLGWIGEIQRDAFEAGRVAGLVDAKAICVDVDNSFMSGEDTAHECEMAIDSAIHKSAATATPKP